MILSKLLLPSVALVGIATGATVVKYTQPKPAPIPDCVCNCPPATEVSLQSLDLEALKKIKGDFNYNPSLSNVVIKIESKDSLLVKSLLKSAK